MGVRGANTSRRWIWAAVILVGCLLAGMSSRPERHGAANLPANAAATVSQPVHSVLSRVGGGLGRAGFFVTHLFSLERENTRLRQQLEQSRALAEQSAEWRQQAARLRELAKIQDPRELPGVAGRVIAHGPSPWFRTVTIDVGQRSGVHLDDAVLAPGGLLGVVCRVWYAACEVLCVTDRLGSVGGRLQPERVRQVVGVCKGDGGGMCALTFTDPAAAAADARPGDPVVTSGLSAGSLFPPGLLVGHVLAVERRADQQSLICRIRPVVDPNRVEEVVVLVAGHRDARRGEGP